MTLGIGSDLCGGGFDFALVAMLGIGSGLCGRGFDLVLVAVFPLPALLPAVCYSFVQLWCV